MKHLPVPVFRYEYLNESSFILICVPLFSVCLLFTGRFRFKEDCTLQGIMDSGLAPIRYVDDDNNPTETYPFNPNGSTSGIAAISSRDGRHLAMMPHPERSVLSWQCPWMPKGQVMSQEGHVMRSDEGNQSPWMCMFYNAYAWCVKGKSGEGGEESVAR